VTPEKITLPVGFRSKQKGGELVLPNLIYAELSSIPIIGNSDYFFPSATGGPFSAWAKNKMHFDKLCGVTDWTLHDIRRTVRTKLAEWECCDDATAERILGHVSAESRISRVYNRWKHFPQMKAALILYEQKLAALIAEK
jgi:integrase